MVRAKEAVRYQTQRVVSRAFRTLQAQWEELQRIVEAEGSSTTTTSHSHGEDLEGEDYEDMSSASVAGSPTRSSHQGLVGKGNRARGTVIELLAGVKRRTHLDMCARLDEVGVVSEVDTIVVARFQEWAATRAHLDPDVRCYSMSSRVDIQPRTAEGAKDYSRSNYKNYG